MSGFSFGSSEEIVQSVYLQAGIHDFLVKEIYYQPVGDSVRGRTKKDGSLIYYNKPVAIIHATVLRTHAGGKSENAEAFIAVYPPDQKNDGKDENRINRLFHILVNIASSAKKDGVRDWLKKTQFSSFQDMITKFGAAAKGKKVRYKLIANDEGKNANLPSYFSGFAECEDIPFSETTLKWDDAKEGNRKQGEVESTAPTTSAPSPEFDFSGGAASNPLDFGPSETEEAPF
jgi:hypothetical protein